MNDGSLECDSYIDDISLNPHVEQTLELTLDLLSLLVADKPRNFHGIADEGIPTRMLHRTLDTRVVADDIDGESSSLGEGAVLVVDGLRLDRLEGDERCGSGTLDSYVLEKARVSE